jgi:teichuronic acid biosynthesis glycosyltransferase TuaC
MKVLVFTNLYPNNKSPNHGVFVKERMTHFAKLDGCSVKVVAPVPYYPPIKFGWRWKLAQVAEQESRQGIEVYHPRYFMIPKVGMTLYGVMMFLSVLSTVKKIRRNFDFDLIDAHFVYPDAFAATLLGRFFKKPVVVSARGSDINLYGRFPLIRPLLRYTLQKSNGIVAVSKALKETMVGLGIPDQKITVIPNGVDTEKFRPLPKKEAREKLGVPLNKKVILSVGHLTQNKGFDLVIKAVKILLQEYHQRNIYLAIVGDGVFRNKLEKVVASSGLDPYVRFTGSLPHEELFLWYNAADLFCLASDIEGWPNVILESLACGTPVVATAAGGIPEIIQSDQIGLLTERDESEIAKAIDVGLAKSWSADDLLRYARIHSWERTAWAVRRVFESVLNGKRDDPGRPRCDDTAGITTDSLPLGS